MGVSTMVQSPHSHAPGTSNARRWEMSYQRLAHLHLKGREDEVI